MLSLKDKCEVSKDKYEYRRKMEYLCEAINLTEGRKGKSKPPLGGLYKDVEVEDAEGHNFSTAFRAFRQLSVFVIELRLN